MNTQLNWQVSNSINLVLSLKGSLERSTLLPFWKKKDEWMKNSNIENLILDFKNIDSIDSAGFAFLVYMLNLGNVKLLNVSDDILELANLFNLKPWLVNYIEQK